MTGAILGGSSVQQAARLQMVIMFMIAAATALASMLVTCFTLMVVVDSEHRIRNDRIDGRKHALWRARDHCGEVVIAWLKIWWVKSLDSVKKIGKGRREAEEGRQHLLG